MRPSPEWTADGRIYRRRFLLVSRLGGRSDLQVRLGELDQLTQRIGELEERVDFAERLLAQQREGQRLGPAHD